MVSMYSRGILARTFVLQDIECLAKKLKDIFKKLLFLDEKKETCFIKI